MSSCISTMARNMHLTRTAHFWMDLAKAARGSTKAAGGALEHRPQGDQATRAAQPVAGQASGCSCTLSSASTSLCSSWLNRGGQQIWQHAGGGRRRAHLASARPHRLCTLGSHADRPTTLDDQAGHGGRWRVRSCRSSAARGESSSQSTCACAIAASKRLRLAALSRCSPSSRAIARTAASAINPLDNTS